MTNPQQDIARGSRRVAGCALLLLGVSVVLFVGGLALFVAARGGN